MKNKQKKKNGKLPKWAVLVIIGLSVLICMPIILFLTFMVYGVTNTMPIENSLSISNPVEGHYDSKTNTYFINGYVKNISKDDVDDIELEYNLYDENNNIIGVAYAYLDELTIGKTWKFTAEYSGKDAKNITHFEKKLFEYDYDTWG